MNEMSLNWPGVMSFLWYVGVTIPAAAQDHTQTPNNIIQTSTSTVEILGLRQWNISMLNDSLRKHEGYDLSTEGAHACAAALRYKLGFPDAAAIKLPGTANTSYWLVTLVEPQDSHQVQYRSLPLDTMGGRPDWGDARRIMRTNRRVFGLISGEILGDILQLQQNVRHRSDELSGSNSGASIATTSKTEDTSTFVKDQVALRSWFAARRTPQEYEIALATLQNDPNMFDRILALNIILPFLNDDRTWTALAQTLIESDGPVRETGVQLLRTLIAAGKRPGDMAAVFPTFHAILNGTSQILMPQIIPLILAFQPNESSARPLLKNGGRMLLAYAEARHRVIREPALALLVALSHQNYGRDVEQWKKWVQSL